MKLLVTIFLTVIGICLPISLTSHNLLSLIPLIIGLYGFIDHLIRLKSFPKSDSHLAIFFSVLTISCFASLLWTIDVDESYTRSVKLAGLFISGLLFLSVAKYLADNNNLSILKYSSYILIFTCVLFFIERFSGLPLNHFAQNIPSSEWIPPFATNWTAVVCVVIIWPILLYTTKHESMLFNFILLTLVVCVAVFSWSQSSLLSIATSLIVFASVRYIPYATVAVFICLAVGLVLSPWLAQWLFAYSPEYLINWETAAASHRMELWDFLGRQIIERPLLGWGVETTGIMPLDMQHLYFDVDNASHPHNAALQLWMDLGLIGCLLGLWLLFMCYKRIINHPNKEYLVAGLISIISVSLTGFGLWQGWWISLMFTSVALFILNKKKTVIQSESE